jgi:hypothetical protein
MQLTSAELSADNDSTIVHSAIVHSAIAHSAVVQTTAVTNTNTTLPFPFGAVQLVTEYREAAARETAAVNAYLGSVAQQRVAVNAYLGAVARERDAVRAYLAARAPRPTPPPAPAPRPVPTDPWSALRQCESSGNYAENTGNGYYGAYQFTAGTWAALGLSGLPSAAPPAVQDQAAQELQARRGWGQWPSCARRLGLL